MVGNSLVRFWPDELKGRARVTCLPGATLDQLVEAASQDVRVSDVNVYIQSGIPDLHVKGDLTILPGKVDLFRRRLTGVHRVVPNAIVMLIYPPLNASQQVCVTYDDLNALIKSLNRGGTPNTVSRIFHKDHEGYFRVESRRLVDGIHPHRYETIRMVKRLIDFMESPDRIRRSSKPSVVVSTEGNATTSQEGKQPLKQMVQQPTAAVTVTVEEPVSASIRVERLLLKKKNRLEALRDCYQQQKKVIEEECVAAIQEVLDNKDEGAVRSVSASSSSNLRSRISKRISGNVASASQFAPEGASDLRNKIPKATSSSSTSSPSNGDGGMDSLVVVDEWSFSARDVRDTVPKRVHFC